MIAVLVSELKSWSKQGSRQNLVIIISLFTLTGLFTALRPEICGIVLNACLIWVVLKLGEQSRNDVKPWEWVRKTNLSPLQIITGKILTLNIIAVFHILIVTPLLIIMIQFWGIEGVALLRALAVMLICVNIAGSIDMIWYSSNLIDGSAAGALSIVIWLVTTFALPQLKIFNPFLQVWAALSPAAHKLSWLAILSNIGLVLIFIIFGLISLKREVKQTV